jgi:hypothetical protein
MVDTDEPDGEIGVDPGARIVKAALTIELMDELLALAAARTVAEPVSGKGSA